VGYLIGRVGRGLKLATTISKAHITVSGLLTKPGAMCKATIHDTSEEVGMALVVMGKQIAQQHMLNPWKPPKPVKQLTPTTLLTAAEEQPPLPQQPIDHTSQMSTPSLHLPLAIR
jgi:hypothetical protein